MNSRKYPRTLQEAFGPYTSHHVEEPALDSIDKLTVFASAVALILFLVFSACGWLTC